MLQQQSRQYGQYLVDAINIKTLLNEQETQIRFWSK